MPGCAHEDVSRIFANVRERWSLVFFVSALFLYGHCQLRCKRVIAWKNYFSPKFYGIPGVPLNFNFRVKLERATVKTA